MLTKEPKPFHEVLEVRGERLTTGLSGECWFAEGEGGTVASVPRDVEGNGDLLFEANSLSSPAVARLRGLIGGVCCCREARQVEASKQRERIRV